MSWIKKLFGKKNKTPDQPLFSADDLELRPSSYSDARAEEAIPGTSEIPPLMELHAPPVDPDLVIPDFEDETRDYGPDPFAEVTARFTAAQAFDVKALQEHLYGGFEKTVLTPQYYVVTPEGQTTFMISSDAPAKGVELLASWSFYKIDELSPKSVIAAASKLAKHLEGRPENFSAVPLDQKSVEAQFDNASKVAAMAPERVEFVAYYDNGDFFNGLSVWKILHAIGFRWGDMDCFQWADPTGMTDYLIWVEADDTQLGYVLPEEVAAGNQNFQTVSFSLNLLRTPQPEHVLEELFAAVSCFQEQTNCAVAGYVDTDPASNDQVVEATKGTVTKLAAMGLKPGSSAVCQIR
jgi:hypothetical protein